MKVVNVGQKILSENEEYARENSRFLAKHKKLCLNIINRPEMVIIMKTICT